MCYRIRVYWVVLAGGGWHWLFRERGVWGAIAPQWSTVFYPKTQCTFRDSSPQPKGMRWVDSHAARCGQARRCDPGPGGDLRGLQE